MTLFHRPLYALLIAAVLTLALGSLSSARADPVTILVHGGISGYATDVPFGFLVLAKGSGHLSPLGDVGYIASPGNVQTWYVPDATGSVGTLTTTTASTEILREVGSGRYLVWAVLDILRGTGAFESAFDGTLTLTGFTGPSPGGVGYSFRMSVEGEVILQHYP